MSIYPVFMYHKVGAPVSGHSDTFLNVSAHDFRRQMRILAKLGYTVRPFAEVAEAIQQNLSLPKGTCAVTFDDGYTCVGQHAAPILAEFGFPGTVFVVSQAIGQTNAWDGVTGRPVLPLMREDELRKLHTDGWEIAGHTRTHPHLDTLSDADALEEIRGGREELGRIEGRCPLQQCLALRRGVQRDGPCVVHHGERATNDGVAVAGLRGIVGGQLFNGRLLAVDQGQHPARTHFGACAV